MLAVVVLAAMPVSPVHTTGAGTGGAGGIMTLEEALGAARATSRLLSLAQIHVSKASVELVTPGGSRP